MIPIDMVYVKLAHILRYEPTTRTMVFDVSAVFGLFAELAPYDSVAPQLEFDGSAEFALSGSFVQIFADEAMSPFVVRDPCGRS
jgi:hypothetical protein